MSTSVAGQVEPPALAAPPKPVSRLLSLDVFRGLTIAGMILVNNPGSWSSPTYEPLEHAPWNGWTPTDLVFPSFLFIVGVAMTFSFDKRLAQGFSKLRLFEQVVRRTLILFMLGLIMYGFGNWRLIGPYIIAIIGLSLLFWDEPPLGRPTTAAATARKVFAGLLLLAAVVYFAIDFAYFNAKHPPATPNFSLRIPGVLQRIAVCYFVASLIVMFFGVRGRAVWAIALLVGYWLIMQYVQAPAGEPPLRAHPEATLHNWLDVKLLGGHLYTERPDPEGVLSTLGGIATTLVGILAGNWLHTKRDDREKAAGLFFAGNLLLFVGMWASFWMPVNKKIWTPSYVLVAGGVAMNLLAMCYWLVDVKGYRRWAAPCMVFGTNAITVFFLSGIVGRMISFSKLPIGADGHVSQALPQIAGTWVYQFITGYPATLPAGPTWVPLRGWLYEHLFAHKWTDPRTASLAFALSYVIFWLLMMTPLYRRRIFIKV